MRIRKVIYNDVLLRYIPRRTGLLEVEVFYITIYNNVVPS